MEKKPNLEKAREILQLLQEDTITPKQAKELVTLLVQLTEKQKQDLITKNENFLSKVSQETFKQIQNALIEIKQKAHDNQLEVRQLTNKQKSLHESKMAQLEGLIEEFRAFEKLDEERLTKDILSKIPEQKEYELLGENVVDSINSLEVTPENQIDAKHIKNLPLVKQFVGGGSSGIKGIRGGSNITVDNSDPQYPTISSTGGSGGGSFGATTQIPYTNPTEDDFSYSANLTFDGSTLNTGSANLKTQSLIHPSNLATIVDIFNVTLNDLGSVPSVVLDARKLYDSTATQNLEWYTPGLIRIGGTNGATFDTTNLTGNHTYTTPNQDGTLALLTDIPASMSQAQVLTLGLGA